MISHSLITIAWMAGALALHAILGITPWFAAVFIIAWWWSREQYWDELKLRGEGRRSIGDVVGTILPVWRPARRNMDLILPAIIAFAAAAIGPAVLP